MQFNIVNKSSRWAIFHFMSVVTTVIKFDEPPSYLTKAISPLIGWT